MKEDDLRSLLELKRDYPPASLYLFHLGAEAREARGVSVLPLAEALPRLRDLLG